MKKAKTYKYYLNNAKMGLGVIAEIVSMKRTTLSQRINRADNRTFEETINGYKFKAIRQ